MFVEDIDAIVGRVTDRILVLGDFNLPIVEWGGGGPEEWEWSERRNVVLLGRINSIPNQNGMFLDLIFSNASTNITVHRKKETCWGAVSPVFWGIF
jgi:hypothetical protein